MAPVYKKKKKKKYGCDSLLNTKTRWLVLGAALICMIIIVAVSTFSGGNFKDISYIPRGEGTLFDNLPGDETGKEDPVDTDGIDAPPPPNQANIPEEYKQPAPPSFNPEQKHDFIEKKYTFILNNLNDYYNLELRRLLQAAKSDYLAVKNGRKDISLTQLANEYLRVGRSLEKEADNNFTVILDQMNTELKDNDLSLDLTKQAEKEYQEIKSQLRKDLLVQLESNSHD